MLHQLYTSPFVPKRGQTPRRPSGIHAGPFTLALILSPILVAALTYPLGLLLGSFLFAIPTFAVMIGGPLYLVLGTPILLIYLKHRHCNAVETAGLAALTIAVLMLVDSAARGLHGQTGFLHYLQFGLIMAPIWGGAFGLIYTYLTRHRAKS